MSVSESPRVSYDEQVFLTLPSIEQLLAESFSYASLRFALSQRDKALGVGTISSHGLMILREQLTDLQISWSILRHVSSITAHEKQAILAEYGTSLLVKKTLTVELGDNTLALVTGVGDFALQKAHIKNLGIQLGLSKHKSKRISINPSWFSPEEYLRMRVGMVSPFFIDTSVLHAIALLPLTNVQLQYSHVAISLSLSESLVIPTKTFYQLVRGYARWAYPTLPIVSLTEEVSHT